MEKNQIIDTLARHREVEKMVENISRSSLTPELQDLSQMVYVLLLEYDDTKIKDLWANNQMQFFIARIIINQVRSSTSRFHYIYRIYKDRSVDITKFDCADE